MPVNTNSDTSGTNDGGSGATRSSGGLATMTKADMVDHLERQFSSVTAELETVTSAKTVSYFPSLATDFPVHSSLIGVSREQLETKIDSLRERQESIYGYLRRYRPGTQEAQEAFDSDKAAALAARETQVAGASTEGASRDGTEADQDEGFNEWCLI